MTITYGTSAGLVVYAELDFNTAGLDVGLLIGSVPKDAKIFLPHVYVEPAFNAGTNAMNIGISPTGIEYAHANETLVGAIGLKHLSRSYLLNPLLAVRTVYVRYVQTGTPATAGKVFVMIPWTY